MNLKFNKICKYPYFCFTNEIFKEITIMIKKIKKENLVKMMKIFSIFCYSIK